MKRKNKKMTLESMSKSATQWMGSPASIVVHTIFFIAIFFLHFTGVALDQIMLILTTAVSLEAIYLSLFIQMTVNRNTESLEEVEEDLDEIQQDVEAVQTSVEDIGEDVDEISADIDEIAADEEAEVAADEDVIKKTNKIYTSINSNIFALTNEMKRLQKEIAQLKKTTS